MPRVRWYEESVPCFHAVAGAGGWGNSAGRQQCPVPAGRFRVLLKSSAGTGTPWEGVSGQRHKKKKKGRSTVTVTVGERTQKKDGATRPSRRKAEPGQRIHFAFRGGRLRNLAKIHSPSSGARGTQEPTTAGSCINDNDRRFAEAQLPMAEG